MMTTSSTPIILILLALLTLAKFDYVQAGKKKVRPSIGCAENIHGFTKDFVHCFGRRSCNKKCKLFGRRHLADNGDLWSAPEIEQCSEDTYETSLYVESGHLFLYASPEKQNSTCPIIVIDSGSSSDGDDKFDLVPHVSLSYEVPAGALSFNRSESLGYLSRVFAHLDPAMHTVAKNEYNVLENNCAAMLLHLSETIALDYKEPTTNSNIINYVGKSLAADKSTVGAIHKAYLEANTGMFVQTMFHAWNYLVGDEGMTRALVRDYMNQTD